MRGRLRSEREREHERRLLVLHMWVQDAIHGKRKLRTGGRQRLDKIKERASEITRRH